MKAKMKAKINLKMKAKKGSSMQLKLSMVIFIFACIYFSSVAVLFYNLQSSVQNRANESYQSILQIYENQLLTGFQEVESFINTLSNSLEVNMLPLLDPQSNEYKLQLYQIRENIFSYFYNYNILDGFYIYDSLTDSNIYIPDDRGHYAELVRDFVSSENHESGWAEARFANNGETVIMRTYKISETKWLFAFINVRNIADEFKKIALENDLEWNIENADGVIIYGNQEISQKYESVSKVFEYGPITLKLNLYVDTDTVWKQSRLYILFLAVSFLVLSVLIIGVTQYARRKMLGPLQLLLGGMEEFAGGNDQIQVEEMSGIEPEIQYALQSFNQMVAQIRENKFVIYETMLEKQKLMIQNMQSQINPHFFSNTTNLIYNLIEMDKIDTAKKCVLLLSSYYRYMTTIGHDDTTIEREMEFVNSYLDIMELRFPNKLTCEVMVEESLKQLKIPPLLIQPLAENCIKHGFTDRKHKFRITIKIFEYDRAACIEVTDNGKGFPEVYRGVFDQNRPIPKGNEEENIDSHVGIHNIYQRLMMMYPQNSSLLIDWTGKQTKVKMTILNWNQK